MDAESAVARVTENLENLARLLGGAGDGAGAESAAEPKVRCRALVTPAGGDIAVLADVMSVTSREVSAVCRAADAPRGNVTVNLFRMVDSRSPSLEMNVVESREAGEGQVALTLGAGHASGGSAG